MKPGARDALWMAVSLASASVAACGSKDDGPSAVRAVPATFPRVATRPASTANRDPGFVGVIVVGESLEVEPKVEGRLLEIPVEPGAVVRAGAVLARLDGAALQHELRGARAALSEARRRFGRRRKLERGASGAVTAEEVDAARREMLEERARVHKLEVAVAETSLTAPFAATVVERYLAPGAIAGPGRPVVRLLGQGEPRVRFAVPEEHAGTIRPGATVKVKVTARPDLLSARVTSVSPEVDASARMVFAAAALDLPRAQAEALTTGLLARVFPVAGVP